MIGSTSSSSARPLAIGFTVNANAAAAAAFDEDLRLLRATGANWVRFGVQHWELGGWFGDRWYWKESGFVFLADCVRKARYAGLKISLTLAAMADVPSWTFDQYLRINRLYWQRVAETVAASGGVDVWQVYNEHDAADFRSQAPLPGPPTRPYLSTLAAAISVSRDVVHAALPGCAVTTAVTGLTVDTNTENRWYHFYDVVAPSVDVIGLNCYPGDWLEQIQNLPTRLSRVRSRYDQQVLVTEIGVPTEVGGRITTASAQEVLPLMIGQAARAAPLAVLVYQLRNSGGDPADAEQNFGIYDHQFNPRPTRDAVVSAVHSY
jgi:hypothetical protein